MTHEHRSPQTTRVSPLGTANHSNSSGVALPAVVQVPKTDIDNQVENGLMNEMSQTVYPVTQRFIVPPGKRPDNSVPADVKPFQLKSNNNERPEQLKSGIENISAFSLNNPPILKKRILPCGHESGRVIQRMISIDPPKTKDMEKLEQYIFGTPINNRMQTFEYAAMESEMGINRFELLKTALKEKDPDNALRIIGDIITLVNETEARMPNHPNKVWNKHEVNNAKADEAPYTISKTPESIKLANEAKKIILAEKILGEDDKFMLGVMVLPDKQSIVALSGSRSEILPKIAQVLKSNGFNLFNGLVYDASAISYKDYNTYKQAAEKEVSARPASLAYQGDKIVKLRTDEAKDNIGSFPANCAAAVALSIAKTVSPESFSKGGRLGLTEVYVSTNKNSEILIYNIDKGEGDKFTMTDKDMPSCHVCQIQLQEIASKVVEMEKQGIVVHLQKSMEDRLTEIKDLRVKIEVYEKEAKERDGQRKLSEQINALSDKQKELIKNLSSTEKRLSNKRSRLNELNVEMQSVTTQIDTLTNANIDKLSKKDIERQILGKINQLERDIKQLKETIGRLEKDEKELESAASLWHIPSYASWYSKLEELQKQKAFRQATKSDIDSRLTNELTARRKELADLEQQQKMNDPERVKGSIEILDKQIKKNNVEKHQLPGKRKELDAEIVKETNEEQKIHAEYEVVKNELAALDNKIKELNQHLDPSVEIKYDEQKSYQLIRQKEKKINEAGIEIDRMKMTANVYGGKY